AVAMLPPPTKPTTSRARFGRRPTRERPLVIAAPYSSRAYRILGSRVALSKNRSTDPDHRRALFDGDGEVVGHSHGEFTQRRVRRRAAAQPITQLAQGSKMRTHRFHGAPGW